MNKISDAEIIESIKRGNKSDFALLIERHKDRGFTLLKRMLKNEMDAEEALQDSFLKVFNSLASFRGESKFSTWFYKIVYNTGLTVLANKKRKIISEMTSVEDHFDLSDNENIMLSAENLMENLSKIIDKLPMRNALVIILFYIDNMSLNEISDVLNLTLVNTKTLLHRSRNALRDLLIKQNFVEEFLWNA